MASCTEGDILLCNPSIYMAVQDFFFLVFMAAIAGKIRIFFKMANGTFIRGGFAMFQRKNVDL